MADNSKLGDEVSKQLDVPESNDVVDRLHNPRLGHISKKSKEYIFEFIMIFLAVALGFFAESYRAYLGEQNNEKEYVKSLIDDLKSDQRVLSNHVTYLGTGISIMDSLITALNAPSKISNHTGQIYYWARLGPRLVPLAANDKTLEQLKNSGDFRLIRSIKTSNTIMNYYEKFRLIRLLESVNETEFTDYKKVAAKIFDPVVFLRMEGEGEEIKRISDNPSLRTTDSELLKELSLYAVYMHGTKKGVLAAVEEIKIEGVLLIEYLQTEYQLE
jgi:hypothetical protein